MEWRDEAILIGIRRHGESSVIAEAMTAGHGRHLGLVRGGRSRRMQPVLQMGNRVELTWRARLDEHLGTYSVEPLIHHAARLYDRPKALLGLQAVSALLRVLPERDNHPRLFSLADLMIDHLDDALSGAELFVRFEAALLDELGFGLDLAACAATGRTTDLIYVSPKSGRAVSADAGAPYADRMLPLPAFLRGEREERANAEAVTAGAKLTAFFLERHVFGPRGQPVPPERAGFLSALA